MFNFQLKELSPFEEEKNAIHDLDVMLLMYGILLDKLAWDLLSS